MIQFLNNIRRVLSRSLFGYNETKLVNDLDDRYIIIQNERFYYYREDLIDIIEKITDRRIMVEVGSLVGFSTRFFTRYFDKVISVDPYSPGYDPSDNNSAQSRLLLARNLFTVRFFDDPTVEQINLPSKDAAVDFSNESLDLVYIDGAHDYESVKSDILSWKPKIRKSSYIAGDDYDWPGLKRAVSEQFPNHEVLRGRRWIAKIE